MKRLLISICVLIGAVVISISTNLLLKNAVEKTDYEVVVCIRSDTDGNDFSIAVKNLNKTWNKYKKILSLFVDRSKLEEINLSVNELSLNSGEESTTQCLKLRLLLKELWEGERFSFRNILNMT